MNLFHTKDKHEFKPLLVEIEERPLNPLGRSLLWIVVIFMVLTSLWLYFAKVDIVVSARGKVIPDGEVKVMQPIETGVISKILVKEGEQVKKGQVLMEIDPSVTETNLEAKQNRLKVLELELARLNALIEDTLFIPSKVENMDREIRTQQNIYETLKSSHEQEQGVLNDQLEQTEEQLLSAEVDRGRLQQLYENSLIRQRRMEQVLDIVARKEYEKLVDETLNLKEQLSMKTHEVQQLDSKKRELQKQRKLSTQKYKNTLLEQLTKKSKELQALKVEIEAIEFKSAKQRLRSPVDGYVGKLMVHTVGGVVTPAEKLISIVPKSVPLMVKAKVLNKDVGFIKKGMESAVKVDTFNFQKYGLIDGKVKHISDDAVEDEKLGPVYEVYIDPEQTSLEVDGETLPLHSGMSVTAELKVGKRRIIEFFIYPLVKYMDEGMSVR